MNRSASLFVLDSMDTSFVKNSTLGLDSGFNSGVEPSAVAAGFNESSRRMSAHSTIGGSVAIGAVGRLIFILSQQNF